MLRWYGDTSRPSPFGISLVVPKSAVWLASPQGLDMGVSRIDRPTEWEKCPCLETKSLMGQGGTFTAYVSWKEHYCARFFSDLRACHSDNEWFDREECLVLRPGSVVLAAAPTLEV